MKIIKHNYYGFKHDKVNSTMEGNPVYCNDLDIEGHTWAIYYCDKPNRLKGHKDFLLLEPKYVNGLNKKQIENYRIVTAIHCLYCDTVTYSPHRHMMASCKCKAISIDGGASYTKISHEPGFVLYEIVKLDIITGTIIPKELE